MLEADACARCDKICFVCLIERWTSSGQQAFNTLSCVAVTSQASTRCKGNMVEWYKRWERKKECMRPETTCSCPPRLQA